MVSFFGDYDTTETVHIPFNTFSSDDPSASVTVTDLAAGDIEIHKDGSTTQRASDAGVTVSIDFDGITGNHMVHIDLSDDTDAGFYAAGSRYAVRLEGITVDGATLNVWIGAFSIGCTLRPVTAGRKVVVDAAGLADANAVKVGPTGAGTAQTAGDLVAAVITNAAGADIAADIIAAKAVVDAILLDTGTDGVVLPQAQADKVWATAARVLTAGDNIALAKGTGVTGFNDLDAAGVRNAVGLASANLDTQISGLPTDADVQTAAAAAITAAALATAANLSTVGGNVSTILGRVIGTLAAGTHEPQSGDAFARLGAPAGASIAADIAALPTDADVNAQCDTAISDAALATAAELAKVPKSDGTATWNATAAATIKTQAASALTDYDPPTKGEMDSAHALLATPAQVNAEVVDALNVDTYAEPGQEAPAATASLATKIGHLFKAWRNKKTQTATEFALYNDAGDTVDQKATVSDDSTTTTVGEIGSGP